MKLFETFERTRRIPMPRRTTQFEGLNECADPAFAYARSFVEDWFQQLPAADQADLYPRLSSMDDVQHQTALFELYLHALLVAMDYTVERHPSMPSGIASKPDFLVSNGAAPLFYLEATSTIHPEALTKTSKRLDPVYDALDEIDCPDFWLSIAEHGGLQASPKLRPLCREVAAWVATLDPDQVSHHFRATGEEASMTWEDDDWHVEITAVPKPPEIRAGPRSRPVGATVSPFRWITPEKGILNRVRDKARKYGDPGLPLVIAVNMLDDCRRGIDVWTGLRRAWGEPDHLRDRQVSAALMCWLPVAIAAPTETPYLVYHPHASRPLERDLWPLPQCALNDDGLAPLMNADKSAPDLLGLRREMSILAR